MLIECQRQTERLEGSKSEQAKFIEMMYETATDDILDMTRSEPGDCTIESAECFAG